MPRFRASRWEYADQWTGTIASTITTDSQLRAQSTSRGGRRRKAQLSSQAIHYLSTIPRRGHFFVTKAMRRRPITRVARLWILAMERRLGREMASSQMPNNYGARNHQAFSPRGPRRSMGILLMASLDGGINKCWWTEVCGSWQALLPYVL